MTVGNAASARPPLVMIPQYFGSLVFDRRTSRYMPFDAQATRILRRLRREPIDAVAADEPSPEDVFDFVEHFLERGFLTTDGRFAGTVLDASPPRDHLLGPLSVHLEVMAACNLKCRHCFAGTLPRHKEPLSLRELDALFATLARMGTFRLGLTGGEPLLRRDIFEIIDLATSHGLCPCITTNGLLMTEAIAMEFGRRELIWLNVSLEGASPATNDAVRGTGVFERVREKLEILGRHARFTLAFTITRENHAEIADCARLAREVGAHTAVFRPLYPAGIALGNLDLMPTFRQYTGALDALAAIDRPRPKDGYQIYPFSPRTRRDAQSKITRNNGCGAGTLTCSIAVNGALSACSFLGPGHDAGNIRETPFDELWNRSERFRRLRGVSAGGFQGGCRARSLVYNGSIDAPDPWYEEYRADAGACHHPMSNIDHDLH